ncbi:hypothetical protein ANCDUO_01823 [Ancylostoma duodenale]|uniref:Serine-threonine/tyrosine-protein kinase catalytic domain-containing protein n=1 Tax=Ancylostoma duodenale TaxID=51022 RepID=A0A0C2H8C6_9BILA|nr:hypothetical protein ANCDUO_01823 [Ancylostoma duodenale]
MEYVPLLYRNADSKASKNKRAEMDRLNALWQIHFTSLTVLGNKNEPVAALKHEIRINFDSKEAAVFRLMRQIENENVNRFIGICIDGPQMMSLWRHCSRGSINDVVMKGALMMDNFFVVSLLKDIVNIFCGQLQKSFALQSAVNLKKLMYTELIYMVKKGGHNALRPPLDVHENNDVNQALLHLIRDCWAERPSERPPIDKVKSSLRSMNTSKLVYQYLLSHEQLRPVMFHPEIIEVSSLAIA